MKLFCLIRIILIFWIISAFSLQALAAEDLSSLINKGNSAFDRGDYEKALKIYEKGLVASPGEAILFYNAGNVHFRQGIYHEAITAYEAALRNNPARVLLKNICFNNGNAYFKSAEKKATQKDDLDTLRSVLSEYESAFAMYRKSLDIERQISIAEGRDIHGAGIYAKRNWALARERWTRTWEEIRELEKKNMKLEDAIKNLLVAQTGMLPPLERSFLFSFSQESLKFSLKTLLQYHLDHKEAIASLRELAAREVEKIDAEIANLKSSSQQATGGGTPVTPVTPVTPPGEEGNPEIVKLQEEQRNVLRIQESVDRAAELEEWTIDSLKRVKPLLAWQKSRLLIDLLQDLDSYLNSADLLKKRYESLGKELFEAGALLGEAAKTSLLEEKDTFPDVKSRLISLAKAKMEMAAGGFLRINDHLALMDEDITLNAREVDPEETNNDSDPAEKEIADRFKRMARNIVHKSIADLKQRNNTIREGIRERVEALNASSDIVPALDVLHENLEIALARYLVLNHDVVSLFARGIKESESLIDELKALVDESEQDPDRPEVSFSTSLSLVDIILFKYQIMVEEIMGLDIAEMEPLKQNLPAISRELNDTWKEFVAGREGPFHGPETIEKLYKKVVQLREDLLKNLLAIGPDAAILLYFERMAQLNSRVIDLLPATTASMHAILDRLMPITERLAALDSILGQYFASLEAHMKKSGKSEEKERKKDFENRIKALSFSYRASSAGRTGAAMIQEEGFAKGDLLLREMGALVEKSRLAFQNQLDRAEKALETAMEWQGTLKAQSREAIAIEAGEGNADQIREYLESNQMDVMALAAIATSKIRETIAATGSKDQDDTGGMAGVSPPGGGPDPAALEEALGFIQEAIIEAQKNISFYKAQEFSNTTEIHDQIIDFLQKALDALKQKKGEGRQGEKDQNPQNGKDKPKDQGDQGDQGQQKKRKPLELTPEQARDLLNQLNKKDDNKMKQGKKAQGGKALNTPRPW
jgi:hypothetical protein